MPRSRRQPHTRTTQAPRDAYWTLTRLRKAQVSASDIHLYKNHSRAPIFISWIANQGMGERVAEIDNYRAHV